MPRSLRMLDIPWFPRPAARTKGKARVRAAAREELLIIGNGMVGQRFCERLVELGATERYRIRVVSEEATQAYDRVHLSDVLQGRRSSELLLRQREWYERHGLELVLSDAVTALDLERRAASTARGRELAFDRLVLATGSRPELPRVPASGGAELLAYRTLDDAERILEQVIGSRGRQKPVVVLGAGLLGIEAARAFQKIGCDVVVLEASSQLLPRQLDVHAAGELERQLIGAGIELRTKARLQKLEGQGAHDLCLTFEDGSVLEAGVVVAACGARARDELGRAAGLRCHARGGVEVDDALRTSVPGVYAIGECASHVRVPHGLVAPGYAMADALARNLMGERKRLGAQAAVTRLKLDLTEVNVFGDPVAATGESLVFSSPGVHRRLVVHDHRLVAAVAIGSWDELAVVQEHVATGKKLPRKALESFAREGTLALLASSDGVLGWPDSAVVCQCANVTCGKLREAIIAGHGSADSLARATGASTLCGTCRPLLVTLTGAKPAAGRDARQPSRLLALSGLAALVVSLAVTALPRLPVAKSVVASGVLELWTNTALKQLSGFSLVALLAGGLAFSLKKRVPRFKLPAYGSLLAVHGALGLAALVFLVAHTGFRLGSNLNLALMVVFLTTSVTGAFAGLLSSALASSYELARSTAAWCRRLHQLTFWPLPALILFHALKTYYF